MSENKVRKFKTRCYYTDYVNHCVRFFLSTPETLKMEGKRKADVLNWLAVQSVYSSLKDYEKQVLTEVFTSDYRLPEGVRIYCEKTGTEQQKVWIIITKISAAIAKRRGLV